MNVKKWLITLGVLGTLLLAACGSNTQQTEQQTQVQQKNKVVSQQTDKKIIDQEAETLKKAQIEAKKQMDEIAKEIDQRRKDRKMLDNNAIVILYNDNYKTANFYIDSSIFNYPDLFGVKIERNKNLDNDKIKIISDNYNCRLDTMSWKTYMVIECKKKDKIKKDKVGLKTYLFSVDTKSTTNSELYKQIKLYKTP